MHPRPGGGAKKPLEKTGRQDSAQKQLRFEWGPVSVPEEKEALVSENGQAADSNPKGDDNTRLY